MLKSSPLLYPVRMISEWVRVSWGNLPIHETGRRKPRWRLEQQWHGREDPTPKEIGDIGEDLAVQYLEAEDYKILYRNYSPPRGGEIDVICREGRVLVFVEVKTLVNPGEHRPLHSITAEKRSQLKKGAQQYIQLLQKDEDAKYPTTFKEIDVPYRFDAVEVTLIDGERPTLNIIKELRITPPERNPVPYRKDFH